MGIWPASPNLKEISVDCCALHLNAHFDVTLICSQGWNEFGTCLPPLKDLNLAVGVNFPPPQKKRHEGRSKNSNRNETDVLCLNCPAFTCSCQRKTSFLAPTSQTPKRIKTREMTFLVCFNCATFACSGTFCLNLFKFFRLLAAVQGHVLPLWRPHGTRHH